jgi:hypothetical protein
VYVRDATGENGETIIVFASVTVVTVQTTAFMTDPDVLAPRTITKSPTDLPCPFEVIVTSPADAVILDTDVPAVVAPAIKTSNILVFPPAPSVPVKCFVDPSPVPADALMLTVYDEYAVLSTLEMYVDEKSGENCVPYRPSPHILFWSIFAKANLYDIDCISRGLPGFATGIL